MHRDYMMTEFELFRSLRQGGRKIEAYAIVRGSSEFPGIRGVVTFSEAMNGTWVEAEVRGLPPYSPAKNGNGRASPVGPFGFHIHEGGSCTPQGGGMNAFMQAGGHFNPDGQPHGNHAGDFPVLFGNDGYSRMSFFTSRFKPAQVVGKTVMIHLNPDDYRSQPAGNSGRRIACGVIEAI